MQHFRQGARPARMTQGSRGSLAQRTESSVWLKNSEISGRQALQDLKAVMRSLGCTVKAAGG